MQLALPVRLQLSGAANLPVVHVDKDHLFKSVIHLRSICLLRVSLGKTQGPRHQILRRPKEGDGGPAIQDMVIMRNLLHSLLLWFLCLGKVRPAVRRRLSYDGFAIWSRAEAMKSFAIATLALLGASLLPAHAADTAMFCKATKKDLFAPEAFSVILRGDKIAYLNDANAFYVNYRVKFERGPELMAEAVHDNGEVLFQIYFINKFVTMDFAGGAKGNYACTSTTV